MNGAITGHRGRIAIDGLTGRNELPELVSGSRKRFLKNVSTGRGGGIERKATVDVQDFIRAALADKFPEVIVGAVIGPLKHASTSRSGRGTHSQNLAAIGAQDLIISAAS